MIMSDWGVIFILLLCSRESKMIQLGQGIVPCWSAAATFMRVKCSWSRQVTLQEQHPLTQQDKLPVSLYSLQSAELFSWPSVGACFRRSWIGLQASLTLLTEFFIGCSRIWDKLQEKMLVSASRYLNWYLNSSPAIFISIHIYVCLLNLSFVMHLFYTWHLPSCAEVA